MSPPTRRRARVGVRTSQEIVEIGLRATLAGHGLPWELADDDDPRPPDLVLYDVLLLHQGDGSDLAQLVRQDRVDVLALGRDLRPDLQARALEQGAVAAVGLGISAADLTEVVKAALVGDLEGSPVVRGGDAAGLLGREVGLSGRESTVLRLIVQGHTNQEIADELYLSINSIKTYIRTTYRKIGVGSRQHAVTWAIKHGFPIERPEPED